MNFQNIGLQIKDPDQLDHLIRNNQAELVQYLKSNPQEVQQLISNEKTKNVIQQHIVQNPQMIANIMGPEGVAQLGVPDLQKKLTQGVAQQLFSGMFDQKQKEMEEEEKKTGKNFIQRCLPCTNIEFYQPHFNVDTETVKQRILAAINPKNPIDFFSIGQTHDFYGPFWIYTTLIFILAGAGNLQSRFLSDQVSYDYSYITTAASIVYIFGSLFPFLIYQMFKLFGITTFTWEKITYLYGYSTVVFIPLTFLCIIPNSFIQWICMLVASVTTVYFLVKNLGSEIERLAPEKKQYALGVIAVLQIMMILFYKLSFFKSTPAPVSSLEVSSHNHDLLEIFKDLIARAFVNHANAAPNIAPSTIDHLHQAINHTN